MTVDGGTLIAARATVGLWSTPGGDVWRLEAACRGVDPAVFFPERGERPGEATAWCRTCPVKADCLEDALVHGTRDGVRGGLSEAARKPLHDARVRLVRCGWCDVPFPAGYGSTLYCSPVCRREGRRRVDAASHSRSA